MDNQLAILDQITKTIMQVNESQVKINNKISDFSSRINSIEDAIEKRVYISSGERLEIRRHIKAAVLSITNKKGWNYKLVSKLLFNAIYTDVNEQYDVPSYHDLPSKYFSNIIEKIDRWTPNQLLIDKVNNRI